MDRVAVATSTAALKRTAVALTALKAVRLTRFEWACSVVMAAGIALRLVGFSVPGMTWDTGWYMTMASTLLDHGEFVIPWEGLDVYTQHYPPLYPILLAGAFAVFGISYAVMHGVALLAFIALVVAAFLTTLDLYGRRHAFAVAAVTAAFPVLVPYDLHAFTETLVAVFFTLTIWAILKSLEEPKYIVWGGVLAALAYLTKASMGPFVLLAGAGGFLWRFAYMRFALFKDKYYLSAGAILGGTIFVWAYRNVARHGWPHWETQRHASKSMSALFAHDGFWSLITAETLWSCFIVLAFAAPFLVTFLQSFKTFRDEATSGLWMAVITPTIVGVFFVSAFFVSEHIQDVVNTLNKRYLVTPIVPILWLGLRNVDLGGTPRPEGEPESGARREAVRFGLGAAGVAVIAAAFALDPTQQFLSLPRILVLTGAVIVGVALVAATTFLTTRVASRTVGTGRAKATRWWLEPALPDWRALAALAAFVAVGLLVGWLWALSLMPFFIAGGVAAAFRDGRAKVAAVAVILFGASCAGIFIIGDEPAIARDLNAFAAANGPVTIAVQEHQEHFVYPFLTDDVQVVLPDQDPHFVVKIYPYGNPPNPPEGYSLWETYSETATVMPGTAVARAIEGVVLAEAPHPSLRAAAYVYVRDA